MILRKLFNGIKASQIWFRSTNRVRSKRGDITAMTKEREIEDARSIRDAGTSGKGKESQFSSSSRKKPKASSSQGFQGQSRDYQGQGQARVSN